MVSPSLQIQNNDHMHQQITPEAGADAQACKHAPYAHTITCILEHAPVERHTPRGGVRGGVCRRLRALVVLQEHVILEHKAHAKGCLQAQGGEKAQRESGRTGGGKPA